MDRRIIAIAAVIAAVICIVPPLGEDASAESRTDRTSMAYLYEGEASAVDVSDLYDLGNNVYYMLDGSANHISMRSYIDDPEHRASVSGDDRSRLGSNIGAVMHVYCLFYMDQGSTYDLQLTYGRTVSCAKVLDPYYITIEGETGDAADLTFRSSSSSDSGDYNYSYAYLVTTDSEGEESRYDLEKDARHVFEIRDGETYRLMPADSWSDALYIEMTYDIEIRSPSGSATVFAAVCIVLAAVAIGILAYAARKPSWSKRPRRR